VRSENARDERGTHVALLVGDARLVIANVTQGRVRSTQGEHLVVALIVAMVTLLVALAGYPAFKATTEGTAAKAKVRVNMPLVAAAELENSSPSPQSPSLSSP
jgi:hypothetical protein